MIDMFLNKNSIVVNGINLGQYLLEAEFQYNKLWSSDSGRNLAGKQSGTLIGIFPKIILQFRRLTKNELEIIIPILDSSRQTFRYYDPLKKTNVTMTTYTGDYSIKNRSIIDDKHKNEGFSCSFIAVDRRS